MKIVDKTWDYYINTYIFVISDRTGIQEKARESNTGMRDDFYHQHKREVTGYHREDNQEKTNFDIKITPQN